MASRGSEEEVGVGRVIGAWAGAQVLTGVETGVLAAGLVVAGDLSLGAAMAVAMTAGLPLLAAQVWWLRRRQRADAPSRREAWLGLGVLAGYTVTAPLVLLASSAALGAVLAALLAGGGLTVAAGPLGPEDVPGWVLALAGGVVFTALAALAVAWQVLAGWGRGQRVTDALAGGLALTRPRRVDLLVAVLCGLSVGWFPAVIAEAIAAALPPGSGGSLAWLDAALRADDAGGRWAMAVVVAVIAPVAEELVFRGFVWDALRRWLRPGAVVVITSALFAAAHLDPVHSPAVFLIGLLLGFLRWSSGSLVPGLVVHVLNNTVGVFVAAVGGAEAGMGTGTAVALAAIALLGAATTVVATDGEPGSATA